MVDIPEHLLRTAQAARQEAGIESGGNKTGGFNPERDSRIPKHLLNRSREGRSEYLASSSNTARDPFAARRESDEAVAANLLSAKAKLLVAVQPVRRALDTADTDLRGQFLNSESLKIGASFTPARTQPKADAYLTVYGNKEVFEEVEGGKALRIGEQRAWRMPVGRNELGRLLRSAGQKPFRDTWRIARKGGVFVEESGITAELAERVFKSATAERTTNSVTLFEGEPNREAYNQSYGNRYAVGVSVTRNPADTPEEAGIFGADFLSLNGSYRVDEGQPNDGSLYEHERTVMAGFSFLDRRPTVDGFANAFTATEVIIGSFGKLIEEPSRANTLLACQAIDRRLG